MNLIVPIAAGYVLAAVITYGILIDRPAAFGIDEIADDIRASQPRLTERQIEYAVEEGHRRVAAIAAALWPLLLGAALLDLPGEIRDRIRTRK